MKEITASKIQFNKMIHLLTLRTQRPMNSLDSLVDNSDIEKYLKFPLSTVEVISSLNIKLGGDIYEKIVVCLFYIYFLVYLN